MQKAFPIVAVLALAIAAPLPATVAVVAATPAPHATPPPEIYHVVTRPLCSELHKHIAPAIAMMLENDQNIKKSPTLFSQYNRDALNGTNNTVSNNAGYNGGTPLNQDVGGSSMTPSQNMALLSMENLVSPIANNIIATQKMLDSPALLSGSGNPEDDKYLQDMRKKLLQALAKQQAALDIVNGFLTTQQMGDLQHAGEEYISAINGSEFEKTSGATPTPNPLMADPNQAGLPPNPYAMNLAAIPGLTLGFNPVTRLLEALHWTIDQTTLDENAAAASVMQAHALCAPPAPTPKPNKP